jgi:dihydroorotate dehydrogenase electron transfer subunit
MISIPGTFLRRPLSIHRARNGRLEFLYRVVGKGTELLSELKEGTVLNVLGPLGHGYDLSVIKNHTPVLVAGGTGMASLNFLAESFKKPGIVFYGARTKQELVCRENLKKLGWKMQVATDDGSLGHKGFVTELLQKYCAGQDAGSLTIFTCGPEPMMRTVARIAATHDVDCYISMEERMACGMGTCQGCVVRIAGKYQRACSDGPVFNAADVDWK